MTATTDIHSFTLYVAGVDLLSDPSMEALHAAGCDDATFGSRDGELYAAFDRRADRFDVALASAIQDLTRALPGLEVMRVEREGRAGRAVTGRARRPVRLV
jgi:hypothetical protein